MGDPTPDKQQPSLEPPQLFGRRKKKAEADAPTEQLPATPDNDTATDTTPDIAPAPTAPPVARTPAPEAEPTPPAPASEPVPAAVAAAPTASAAPAPVREQPVADSPLFADEAPAPSTGDKVRSAGGALAGRLTSRFRSVPARTPTNGLVTSALTGLVVGLVLVGLTFAAFKGCEAVRGTSTCGGGPGFVLLVLTLVVGIIVGRVLLTAFKVPDPGSTSFLAVGLTAVIVLLFFIDLAMSWPMIVVMPLLGAATFMASYWLTTNFVEPAKL